MKNFQLFLDYALNQGVEVSDKSNVYQCMDLAYNFCLFLNVPKKTIQHLHAYEVYKLPNETTKEFFELIPNTATFVPQQGDLCVFGKEVGVSGHISIATGKGDTKTFESLDQNWGGVSKSVYIIHKYGGKEGLLGVLRFKKPVEVVSDFKFTQEQMDKMRLERDDNDRLFKAELEQHQKDLDDISIALHTSQGKSSILARAKAIEDEKEEDRQTIKLLKNERDDLVAEKEEHLRRIDELTQAFELQQLENVKLLGQLNLLREQILETQRKESLLDRLFKLFQK